MKVVKLPPIEELKELVKEPGNLTFYKRVKWQGPIESVEFLKRKIKEYNTFLDDSKKKYPRKTLKKSWSLEVFFVYYNIKLKLCLKFQQKVDIPNLWSG